MKEISASEIEKRLMKYGLGLGKWSPGDGWTRYRVESPDSSREFSQNLTLAELRVWYRGFMSAKTGERCMIY